MFWRSKRKRKVDFCQVGPLIEKGREAAEAKIEQIKKDLES